MFEKLLTKEIAEDLRGETDFNEFTAIDDSAAEVLASPLTIKQRLSGHPEINDSTAEALASYEVKQLGLNGLSVISPATARSLGQFNGNLFLNGLKTICGTEAEAHSSNPCALVGRCWRAFGFGSRRAGRALWFSSASRDCRVV